MLKYMLVSALFLTLIGCKSGELTQKPALDSEPNHILQEEKLIPLSEFSEIQKFNTDTVYLFNNGLFSVSSAEPLKLFYGERIGFDENHSISAFQVPEQLSIADFVSAHVFSFNDPDMESYEDYAGSSLHKPNRQFDFYKHNYQNYTILVRIEYDTESTDMRDKLYKIVKTLQVNPDRMELTSYENLFIPTDEQSSSSTLFTFVPFKFTNYGINIMDNMNIFHFHDGTRVGLDDAQFINLIEYPGINPKQLYNQIQIFPPWHFDKALLKYAEYMGTETDRNGVRVDSFLYSDDLGSTVVRFRYFEQNKPEVLPLFLQSAGTLKKLE